MNETFTLTGGARIGWANATFPFANLFVDENVLKINASIVGNLVFLPADIILIEPYSKFALFGQGIKINHRVEGYNATVIFWTFKNPRSVIDEIKRTGFLDNLSSMNNLIDADIINRQRQGSFPIKKSVAIIFVVLWNVLFLSDNIPFFLHTKRAGFLIGTGAKLALALVIITSVLALVSEKFRKVILKEGRKLDDIKKFLYFIILICTILFLGVYKVSFSR